MDSAPAPVRSTTPPAATTLPARTTKPSTTAPQGSGTATPAAHPAAAKTMGKTTAPKATAPPKTTAAPALATDAQGRLLCTGAMLGLTSTAGQTSYQSGSQAILGLTVTNQNAVGCVANLSGSGQVYTVYSAQHQRMWSTADCFPGKGTDVRMIDPGESLHYSIRWAGTTSNPGCTATRVPVPAGSYTVVAQLGALTAAPAKFTVTG